MNHKVIVGSAVAMAAGAVVFLRPASTPPLAPASTISTPARLPKLLDLGATTCVPCKAMVPVLDGLRTDYAGKLDVEFIDIWKNHEAGEAWHVAVMPTQVFFAADGKELVRHEGFISRADILAQWKRLGVSLD